MTVQTFFIPDLPQTQSGSSKITYASPAWSKQNQGVHQFVSYYKGHKWTHVSGDGLLGEGLFIGEGSFILEPLNTTPTKAIKSTNLERWTVNEDKDLLEIVRDIGHNWKLVAENMGRSPSACFNRWKLITGKNQSRKISKFTLPIVNQYHLLSKKASAEKQKQLSVKQSEKKFTIEAMLNPQDLDPRCL